GVHGGAGRGGAGRGGLRPGHRWFSSVKGGTGVSTAGAGAPGGFSCSAGAAVGGGGGGGWWGAGGGGAGGEGGARRVGGRGRKARLGVDEGEHLVQPAFVADRGARVAAAQLLQPGGGVPATVQQGGARVGHGAGEVSVGVAGVQRAAGSVVLQLLQLSER